LSGDVDEEKEKEVEKEYTLLCDWMKQNLGDKVAKVQVSKRISSSPCVLVSGKFGWSANMERCVLSINLVFARVVSFQIFGLTLDP
jgi:HSP90 family molecular chaperone